MRLDVCVLRRSKENWKNRRGWILEVVASIPDADFSLFEFVVRHFDEFAKEIGLEKGVYYIRPNFGGRGIGFGKPRVVVYD